MKAFDGFPCHPIFSLYQFFTYRGSLLFSSLLTRISADHPSRDEINCVEARRVFVQGALEHSLLANFDAWKGIGKRDDSKLTNQTCVANQHYQTLLEKRETNLHVKNEHFRIY